MQIRELKTNLRQREDELEVTNEKEQSRKEKQEDKIGQLMEENERLRTKVDETAERIQELEDELESIRNEC